MAPLRIDPGSLNHLLVLEAPTGESDGAGGILARHAAIATLFGRVSPLGPVEADDGGFSTLSARMKVVIRARSGLAIGQRFRFRGQRIVIEAVSDPDGTGRYLDCLCREDPA